MPAAALIVGGSALDKAMAIPPFYCDVPVVGCNSFACTAASGNCSDPPYSAFVNAFQQGYTYVPCTASTGTRCPASPVFYNVCWSGGYNPTVTNPCGVLVCGTWYQDAGC